MAAVDVADLLLAVGQHGDARVRQWFAVPVDDAAGDRHPASGRMRLIARARLRPGHPRERLAFPGSRKRIEIPRARGQAGEQQECDSRRFELVPEHRTEDLPGKGRRRGRERLAGRRSSREADRGPGRDVAQGRRDGRPGRPRIQHGGQRNGGQHDPAAGESLAELIPRPGDPAADRAVRPPQPPRRLVDRESLEVAQYDRQAERVWEPLDLEMQRLGLLAGNGLLVGRRPRRLDQDGAHHAAGLLVLAPASQPEPDTPRRPQCDPIEPVAQQVGVADRPGLPRQHEEDRLEGVLGELAVRHKLPADAQHHRPVPRHDRGERRLACGVGAAPGVEPLHELPVGETRHGAALEERPELTGHGTRCLMRHGHPLTGIRDPSARRPLVPTRGTVTAPAIVSQAVDAFARAPNARAGDGRVTESPPTNRPAGPRVGGGFARRVTRNERYHQAEAMRPVRPRRPKRRLAARRSPFSRLKVSGCAGCDDCAGGRAARLVGPDTGTKEDADTWMFGSALG